MPVCREAPWPRLTGCFKTVAPARLAISAVASEELSSTTTTFGKILSNPVTVSAMTSASQNAGTTTCRPLMSARPAGSRAPGSGNPAAGNVCADIVAPPSGGMLDDSPAICKRCAPLRGRLTPHRFASPGPASRGPTSKCLASTVFGRVRPGAAGRSSWYAPPALVALGWWRRSSAPPDAAHKASGGSTRTAQWCRRSGRGAALRRTFPRERRRRPICAGSIIARCMKAGLMAGCRMTAAVIFWHTLLTSYRLPNSAHQ